MESYPKIRPTKLELSEDRDPEKKSPLTPKTPKSPPMSTIQEESSSI